MTTQANKNRYATFAVALFLLGAPAANSQNTPEMREILNRLERLEQENQALSQEVHALRQELSGLRKNGSDGAAAETASSDGQGAAPENAPAQEAAAVERARVDELAQTKVEASQKFPIRVTGMVLFNAFVNGRDNGGMQDPVVARPGGDAVGGGTLAQTTLGLLYNGPQTFLGGKVTGSLYMDFFGGSDYSIGHLFRIRTASINLDWANTSLMFGQDKPLISPRDPDSLAQVGYSPLTAAGNPWIWQPQIRVERRFSLTNDSGIRAQAAVFQTTFPDLGPSSPTYQSEGSRPGAEGRLEFWHRWAESGRFEIAGGVHYNHNHLGGVSLPSNVYSVDFLFRPFERLQFTGMYFHGRNVDVLGALPPGFTILPSGEIAPVQSDGGWAQMRIPITSRLAFNLYGGEQSNRGSDLVSGNALSNAAYFSNFMYRIAPNVIVSLEGGQVRTAYYLIGNRLNDHYDLAIGYLF